ncbi:MAG: HipA domain-containing protein [Candidatus Riflebacteria bacterium]
MMKEAKNIDELRIFKNDTPAGTLKRTKNGCEFIYDEEFLQQSFSPGISFCMPKTRRKYSNNGINLFPFFAGLLPEGLRLKAITKNLKTSEDDLFSIFADIGSHVIGDVYAKTESAANEAAPPKLSKINYYDYFQKIISGSELHKDESIAGIQEKISASMISFPINIARQHSKYILKLNPADKTNLVINEHYCMELARKCGIDSASTRLVKDKDGNFGLLVTRFDRSWSSKENHFLMHHQEDACQLLNKYPAEKYRMSFNEVVQAVKKHVPAARVATLKLLQLYAYSYLIGNGDLHAKNISLLIKSGSRIVEISPAYDLICTRIYGDHKMAMKLDGHDDNIKRKNLIEFGKRFDIPEVACESMLDKLLKKFEEHFEMLYKIPTTSRNQKLLDHIIGKRLKDLSQ